MRALWIALLLLGACSKKPKDAPQPDPTPAPTPTPNPNRPDPAPTFEPATRPAVDMPPVKDVAQLAKASNAFGFELWKKLPQGNVAMSPVSITTALAMTWAGAKATTAAEMKHALHFDGDVGAVSAAWGKLGAALQNPKHLVQLRMANRLFGERTYELEPGFVDLTAKAFGAPVEPLDFVTQPDASRTYINKWVESQTNKRIKDLLPASAITNMTRLVLVNAIYFLAEWQLKFEKAATRDAEFTTVSPTGQAKKQVPTMHNVGSYRIVKSDGVTVLEMPYQGIVTAMLVILPDKVDGLADVEKSLDTNKLIGWATTLAPQEVSVALPKFVIDPKEPTELSGFLKALGMKDAFDEKRADFSGIAAPPDPEQRLYITAVFHKAFVKVDEKGTEAAAATAVVMAPKGAAPKPALELKVDHPFLFLIVDRTTGLVHFMGRVVDPS